MYIPFYLSRPVLEVKQATLGKWFTSCLLAMCDLALWQGGVIQSTSHYTSHTARTHLCTVTAAVSLARLARRTRWVGFHTKCAN